MRIAFFRFVIEQVIDGITESVGYLECDHQRRRMLVALDRNGLVKRRKRRRYKARGTSLIGADAPNGLWCADYKSVFMLGNREYCYPARRTTRITTEQRE